MIIAGGIHGVLDQGQHGIILRFGFLPSLERLLYSGRRLVVLALYATSTHSTEWGGDLHGPRMIFPEKIGTFFVPYSRRGPAFDLLLSISLLERMIPGEMTLVIKIFGRKGSGKSRQRRVSGIMMVQESNRRAKTHSLRYARGQFDCIIFDLAISSLSSKAISGVIPSFPSHMTTSENM